MEVNEIFVFYYNLLLLGLISLNPVFKLLSFFLSDQCTLNSTHFNLHRQFSGRQFSGWGLLPVAGCNRGMWCPPIPAIDPLIQVSTLTIQSLRIQMFHSFLTHWLAQ